MIIKIRLGYIHDVHVVEIRLIMEESNWLYLLTSNVYIVEIIKINSIRIELSFYTIHNRYKSTRIAYEHRLYFYNHTFFSEQRRLKSGILYCNSPSNRV